MTSRLAKTALATCLMVAGMAVETFSHDDIVGRPRHQGVVGKFAIPTAPPGMVSMTVYVPAQQMQAPIPPHTHAPQATQTIDATHCSINDVAVLTQDALSCEKAGGTVVAVRASFSCHNLFC